MKLLLDTQIFIWWDSEPEKLPASILELCEKEIFKILFVVIEPINQPP